MTENVGLTEKDLWEKIGRQTVEIDLLRAMVGQLKQELAEASPAAEPDNGSVEAEMTREMPVVE